MKAELGTKLSKVISWVYNNLAVAIGCVGVAVSLFVEVQWITLGFAALILLPHLPKYVREIRYGNVVVKMFEDSKQGLVEASLAAREATISESGRVIERGSDQVIEAKPASVRTDAPPASVGDDTGALAALRSQLESLLLKRADGLNIPVPPGIPLIRLWFLVSDRANLPQVTVEAVFELINALNAASHGPIEPETAKWVRENAPQILAMVYAISADSRQE